MLILSRGATPVCRPLVVIGLVVYNNGNASQKKAVVSKVLNHKGHEGARRLKFQGFPSCTLVSLVVKSGRYQDSGAPGLH